MMAVVFFGMDSWVLSGTMRRMAESTYVEFLHQITGKMTRHKDEGFWETAAVDKIIWVEMMHSADTYIGHWKSKVE